MFALSAKLTASVVALAVIVASAVPAAADDAKLRKHKKLTASHTAKIDKTKYRGANLFPAGPVYFGDVYLGDDPDPFIRSQLYRDLGAHFGDNN